MCSLVTLQRGAEGYGSAKEVVVAVVFLSAYTQGASIGKSSQVDPTIRCTFWWTTLSAARWADHSSGPRARGAGRCNPLRPPFPIPAPLNPRPCPQQSQPHPLARAGGGWPGGAGGRLYLCWRSTVCGTEPSRTSPPCPSRCTPHPPAVMGGVGEGSEVTPWRGAPGNPELLRVSGFARTRGAAV